MIRLEIGRERPRGMRSRLHRALWKGLAAGTMLAVLHGCAGARAASAAAAPPLGAVVIVPGSPALWERCRFVGPDSEINCAVWGAWSDVQGVWERSTAVSVKPTEAAALRGAWSAWYGIGLSAGPTPPSPPLV